jgi:hypothetical protein
VGPLHCVKCRGNGAKVVEDPHSRIGGEVNNSVISAYSNKGHDFFRKLSFGVTLVQTVIIEPKEQL